MVVNPATRPTEREIAAAREQYQRQLVQEEDATVQRMLTAYQRLLRTGSPIDRAMQALVDRITTMEEPSPQDVQDLKAYQDFIATVKQDMDGFSAIYQNEAANLTESAASIANQSALDMAVANVPIAQGEITVGWNQPDPRALADLVSIVDNDTWRANQAAYGDNAAEYMSDVILGMVAQGKNPRFIARGITDAMNTPYAWADNTVRTAQIYSYRRVSHLAYASNPQFIEGWVWQATLDPRTCFSCVSQHGRLYKIDQTLNDHHRGRCSPLPKVVGTSWHQSMQSGEDWFKSLTAKEHQVYRASIRNNKLYDAVLNGDVPFNELSVPYQDSVYGEMMRQVTYKEIVS